MAGQREPLSISTRDIHEYLSRRSQLCDSRIEDAYMRLSSRHGQSRPASPASFNGLERRTLSSSSLSAPSRKHVTLDEALRPSSAHERRPNDSIFNGKPKGILKKTDSPVSGLGSSRNRIGESPDEWFQRIMHVKKLSPLDLCEIFSYGDARKHPLVPLSHVCEVLFDLDPESANSSDPVTDEMEEFLYQFATEESGAIMVNVREALRALNIWQSRVTSSSAQVAPSKLAADAQSKAIILESKNQKLKDVISSLQYANLRLSRQLDSAKLSMSPKSTEEPTPPAWSPRSRATMRTSSVEVSPVKFNAKSPAKRTSFSPLASPKSSTLLQVINLHEKELVEIATKLQFTGAKRLEELLIEADEDSTGFVNLKQLCYILADQFDLKVSETRLIEVCLGMNFNSHAQLDFREFVDVLMDILIYALPDIRESAKRKSLIRLDQYLQSGFPPGREGARQLLDALCSKYDLEGDQVISVTDLVRVFHLDLVKQHALELPFPLEEHETVQLAHPFIQHKTQDKSSDGFLSYSELLDAILGPFPMEPSSDMTAAKYSKRALRWEFWRGIYMTLCGGDTLMEQKVLAQLGRILTKLDREAAFTISTRYFKRIFERHICSDDMEVAIAALGLDGTVSDGSETGVLLRYDVLLKMVFGSPGLNDDHFFASSIQMKVLREQDRLRAYVAELMTTKGSSHRLSLQDFHDAFVVQADEHPLAMAELLYLFGSVDSSHEGSVEVKALKHFLSRRCWKDDKRCGGNRTAVTDARSSGGSYDVESIKKLVAKGCAGYDLYHDLDVLSRKSQGWISQSAMVKELMKMMHQLGFAGVQQDDLKSLVQHISHKTAVKSLNPSSRDGIHCDAWFNGLFDWNSMASSLRLPHSLVEVKKVFEKFDWEHVGSIRCDDWNKAYRLLSHDQQAMADWEIGVLQRRFPGQGHHRERDLKVDYARLIVFLLDYQQRQARKSLQTRVLQHFEERFAIAMSTAEMERLYRALDADNKGYFNAEDLKLYLTKEFEHEAAENTNRELESDSTTTLLNNADALASVMRLLAGDNANRSLGRSLGGSSAPPTIVTFERFREIKSSFGSVRPKTPSLSNSSRSSSRFSPPRGGVSDDEDDSHTISSLRVLELTILEIASEFSDAKGNVLPARAFRHLSMGSTPPTNDGPRPTPPGSPLRRSSLSISSTSRATSLSSTVHKKKRALEASTLDPLTPARLKQLLQIYHRINVSTHLLSQFFLHIGSPSKYFLDLMHFAQWAAPLSVELQVKVRGVVRQMIVKGKGGGGRVNLDRFLALLQRRLQDSPHYVASMGSAENPPLQFVSMSLLLSKLHQLNIPLHKQELMALLRHFGMEDDVEAVDYALFLQRLYELNTAMTS